jgi:hypothetical protein
VRAVKEGILVMRKGGSEATRESVGEMLFDETGCTKAKERKRERWARARERREKKRTTNLERRTESDWREESGVKRREREREGRGGEGSRTAPSIAKLNERALCWIRESRGGKGDARLLDALSGWLLRA